MSLEIYRQIFLIYTETVADSLLNHVFCNRLHSALLLNCLITQQQETIDAQSAS
jgi:hypothetical protein